MNLSPHFTLEEFTHSQTAARMGLDNTPHATTVAALSATAAGMEMVRAALGSKPIVISSGYRSPTLNTVARGSRRSQHLLGEACDFTCPAFGTPREIVALLVDSTVPYDQLIYEYGAWVHISFGPRNRREVLIIDRTGTRPWG
jgi:hypothetical protein